MRKKSHFLTLIFSFSFLFEAFAADTTRFVYNDFSDLSAWQLNGNSTEATNSDSKDVLRLTTSRQSQSSSAFIKNPVKLVSDKGFMASFSAFFSFRMSNNGGLDEGEGNGADGIVFVIQTVANNVGTVGGGIGYRGLSQSFGVEFDTWANGEFANDPDENHVGINTNGSTESIITHSEKEKFNNGAIWYAWIDYDGDNQLLDVRYDNVNVRPVSPKISTKLDLPSLLVQENAFVGFTSATGLSYSTHEILSFNFINKFQPFLYTLTLSADSTAKSRDSVYVISTVRDMNNVVQGDSAKKTQWRIIDAGDNPLSVLKTSIGSEALVIPEVAYSQITIEAKALVDDQTLIDTITIVIVPGDPYKIVIESNPVSSDTFSLRHASPVDTVVLLPYTDTVSVFAVVRDWWDNYCRMADSLNAVWQVIRGNNIITAKGKTSAMYHGYILRSGPQQGIAVIEASENGLVADSVIVNVEPEVSPYLTRAVYSPTSGLGATSSLTITFSEDVDLNMLTKLLPEVTLQYFSSGGKNSEQILVGSVYTGVIGEQFGNVTKIQLGSGDRNIIPDLDSIKLILGTVSRQGGRPDRQSSSKVPIEVENGTITIVASPNPVKLSGKLADVFSVKIVDFYQDVIGGKDRGVLVSIHSTMPLKKDNGHYGRVDIYDAVGNIVAKNLRISQANSNTKVDYATFWDGTNLNNRTVGKGVYLAKVRVVDIKEVHHVFNVKIGVAD